MPLMTLAVLVFAMNLGVATYTTLADLRTDTSQTASAATASYAGACEHGKVYAVFLNHFDYPILETGYEDTRYPNGTVWLKWGNGAWTAYECISTPSASAAAVYE